MPSTSDACRPCLALQLLWVQFWVVLSPDRLSWRWCFWINLPFGALSLIIIALCFQNPPLPHKNVPFVEKIKNMDLLGAAFFTAAIITLLLALQWGGVTYPWSDRKVWGCLLSFVLLFAIFCFIQYWMDERATMPPRLLCRNRTVIAAVLLTMFVSVALFTHIYYLPFYFQAVQGVSAEQSGIRCVPYLISMTVGSILAGAFITSVGYYNPPMLLGSIMFVVGAALLHTLRVDSNASQWIGYQVIAGLGVGGIAQIPYISMQASLDRKDMPIGNALGAFFTTFGGVIGLSIGQNVFANTLLPAVQRFAPNVNYALLYLAGLTQPARLHPHRSAARRAAGLHLHHHDDLCRPRLRLFARLRHAIRLSLDQRQRQRSACRRWLNVQRSRNHVIRLF